MTYQHRLPGLRSQEEVVVELARLRGVRDPKPAAIRTLFTDAEIVDLIRNS